MTGQQLKNSILQMAVSGKLVPQDPDDEPASVLLERIRAEKERLIATGKIKRDKHESVIYRRDNSHYEKIDGAERCIDDEIPFEIPESWAWCRFGSLVQINPRNILSDELEAGFMPMPLLKDGFANEHSYELRKWKDVKSGFTHFSGTAGQQRVGKDFISNYLVPLPPLEEQKRISKHCRLLFEVISEI